jgi:hypothetical protein
MPILAVGALDTIGFQCTNQLLGTFMFLPTALGYVGNLDVKVFCWYLTTRYLKISYLHTEKNVHITGYKLVSGTEQNSSK